MKFVLATVAAVLFGSNAYGADMPAKAAAINSYAAAPTPGWTGFYFGATLGAGWSDIKTSFLGDETKFDKSQFLPGGVLGYRLQHGVFVLGGELSGTWGGGTTTVDGVSTKLRYFGDVTGQIGIAVNKDLVVYALAGPALANAQADLPITKTATLTSTANHFGWVVGGGVDTKLFSENLIVGVVYKHYAFGDASYFGIINANATQDVVQARLMYRFH